MATPFLYLGMVENATNKRLDMEETFYDFQKRWVLIGRSALIENIKICIYKTDPHFFDFVDFENDSIYLDPLFFVLFSGGKVDTNSLKLLSFVYGATDSGLRKVVVGSDQFGRIYLPKTGWVHTKKCYHEFDLYYEEHLRVYSPKSEENASIEKLEIIEGTNIELMKYHLDYFSQFYTNTEGAIINVEIEKITKEQKSHLTIAFHLIKNIIPRHFFLIELVVRGCVIFNIDSIHRNSFATQSALGVAFFNAYQKDYNEVFFVDDIAHQTGHIIFMYLIYDINQFLKVDQFTMIQEIQQNSIIEKRTVLVLFHALYTYYTTFLCLDACLDAKIFKSEKKLEALARIGFYLIKCDSDLSLIENSKIGLKPESIFTENGKRIYDEVKSKYYHIRNKWHQVTDNFNYSNQPYNFSFIKFKDMNLFKY